MLSANFLMPENIFRNFFGKFGTTSYTCIMVEGLIIIFGVIITFKFIFWFIDWLGVD